MKQVWRRCWMGLVLLCLLLAGCQTKQEALELSLRKSFKKFLEAIELRDRQGLEAVVYFPGVDDYRDHVSQLLLEYLENAQEQGEVSFDPQGVVLARFLGLLHHSYEVLDTRVSEDGRDAEMRISVRFSYDNNIAYNLRSIDFDPGTRVLIPGRPFGKVVTITLGTNNPVPREQLSFVEIDVEFRKTNYEGLWQVRRCEVVPGTHEWETSIKERFDY